MKPDPRPHRLLDDLVADDAAFRDRLLENTLDAVRRRRRRRKALQASALALAVAGAVWFRPVPSPEPALPVAARSGVEMVRSAELPERMLVFSRPASVDEVRSGGGPEVVRTSSRKVPMIDDDALFRLLAGRPAMIIRPAGGPARLVLPEEPETGSPFTIQ